MGIFWDQRQIDRIERKLDSLLRQGVQEMGQLDDIKTELDSLVSNVDTFIADAQAALANGDPVKAAAILSELQAENAKVVAALATVAPPPAP